MRPLHTNKSGRRYRYYVSPTLVESSVSCGAKGWRLPAEEVEAVLARAISDHLGDPETQSSLLVGNRDQTERITNAIEQIRTDLQDTQSRSGRARLVEIVRRVDMTATMLTAEIELGSGIDTEMGVIRIAAPIAPVRRGAELKLVLKGAAAANMLPDPNLVACVLDARRRLKAYLEPEGLTLSEIAAAEGMDGGDLSRSLQLAFLAADLVRDSRRPSACAFDRHTAHAPRHPAAALARPARRT